MSLEGAIAVNRFGLGARPGEVAKASENPKLWLKSQIAPAPQPTPLEGGTYKSAGDLLADGAELRNQLQLTRNSGDAQARKMLAQKQRDVFIGEMRGRFNLGFSTDKPFAERLVWFWANHFTISAQTVQVSNVAGAYEREAIRPHIAGKFEDMLFAMSTHPAMLLYLNNAQSIGPNSPAGRNGNRGLNENFGRELMELYSLGVDGGYTQDDVIALAKLLTGWSVDNGPAAANALRPRALLQAQNQQITVNGASSGFRFYPARHEPGSITLRGKVYPAGFEGGREAIRDLARDPSTASFIAHKFARHFIADDPPAASVARLEQVFLRTGGDLKALAEAAIDDPAAWSPVPGKMRNPIEYVTASYRLLNLPQNQNMQRQVMTAIQSSRLMGQFPMNAPAPNGWPDDSASWSGPDAVMSRIEWAKQVGTRLPQNFSAEQVATLADNALGPMLSTTTRSTIAGQSNAGDALALLLSSPEFQRR